MPIDQTTRDLICERIANGESLRAICAELGTPSKALVLKEVQSDPQFRDHYTCAREAQADVLAEEIVEIADDSRNDWMDKNDPDNPGYQFNHEHAARARLRVDARKWFASKVAPKKYGDKVAVTGADGGAVLMDATVRFVKAKPQPDDDQV